MTETLYMKSLKQLPFDDLLHLIYPEELLNMSLHDLKRGVDVDLYIPESPIIPYSKREEARDAFLSLIFPKGKYYSPSKMLYWILFIIATRGNLIDDFSKSVVLTNYLWDYNSSEDKYILYTSTYNGIQRHTFDTLKELLLAHIYYSRIYI